MKTKILVIDDEDGILTSLKMVKLSDNVELLFCNNAKEALLLIPQVDAIISDVQMPNQTLLEEGLNQFNSEMIYRMTGNINYDFNQILLKPFSLKKFREVISDLVQKNKQFKNSKAA